MENMDLLKISYLLGSLSFIVGLKMLSSPDSARKGNLYAAVGMLIAILATIFFHEHTNAETGEVERIGNLGYIIGGIAIGTIVGYLAAMKVKMTAMPQMVSLFNGMGGACAALIGIGALIGTRFARIAPKTLLSHLAAALGSFAVAVALSATFVAIVAATMHVRFGDLIVAFAPGAMDAMMALALTLHIDPVFVGAHHLSRFVFVSIATPGIVHLFGRPQDDLDD